MGTYISKYIVFDLMAEDTGDQKVAPFASLATRDAELSKAHNDLAACQKNVDIQAAKALERQQKLDKLQTEYDQLESERQAEKAGCRADIDSVLETLESQGNKMKELVESTTEVIAKLEITIAEATEVKVERDDLDKQLSRLKQRISNIHREHTSLQARYAKCVSNPQTNVNPVQYFRTADIQYCSSDGTVATEYILLHTAKKIRIAIGKLGNEDRVIIRECSKNCETPANPKGFSKRVSRYRRI